MRKINVGAMAVALLAATPAFAQPGHGPISGGGGGGGLPGANQVTETMLKCVNSPTDEYVLTYESTTGDFEWQVAAVGDVVGPASSTDNALARWDSTTGKLLQNSGVSADDNGRLQTGNGANGGVSFGNAGARIYDSNNDGRLDFVAGGSSQMDLVDTGGGYRLRVLGGNGMSAGNVLLNGSAVNINGDTALSRAAAGVFGIPGMDLADGGTRPTCDSSIRGRFWFEEGGAGVADTVSVCAKDAADAYGWHDLY